MRIDNNEQQPTVHVYINMQTPPSTGLKRKPLVDLTNVSSDEDIPLKTDCSNLAVDLLPIITRARTATSLISSEECERFQNVHPLLGWYKHDLRTGLLSYDNFCELMNPGKDIELINLLAQIGVLADSNQCMMLSLIHI